MTIFERIKSLFGFGSVDESETEASAEGLLGGPVTSPQPQGPRYRGRFDAASDSDQTRKHWEAADGLSPNAAANEFTRTVIRNRGRYETQNNPYMVGGLLTLANDVVGTCPRIQLLTDNESVNRAVEERFTEWGEAIRLGQKLRLARRTRAGQGAVLIRLIQNRGLRHPVQLDLQLIEIDQLKTPFNMIGNERFVDGIEYDEWHNPVAYYVTKKHPGDAISISDNDIVRVDARDIIHYFRIDRPGQKHGLPEIVSSLNLTAERRSMRQSTGAAVRACATLGAVILESQAEPDEADVPDPFVSVETQHGMMTTAPGGMVARQMMPTQPGTTYGEFNRELVSEQFRPLNIPYNIGAADSSRHNYASGRLDSQGYDRSGVIDQDDMVLDILRPIVQAWAAEATATPGYLPGRAGQVYLPTYADPEWRVPCTFIWGDRPHVDPSKEVTAENDRIRMYTGTRAEAYARRRQDWRDRLEQCGVEQEVMAELGLLRLDPQLAPRVAETLAKIPLLGDENAVEMLTLLGVPPAAAKRMVANTPKQLPPTPRDPSQSGQSSNGRMQEAGNGRY